MHLRAICSHNPRRLQPRPRFGGAMVRAAVRVAARHGAEGALSQPQGRTMPGRRSGWPAGSSGPPGPGRRSVQGFRRPGCAGTPDAGQLRDRLERTTTPAKATACRQATRSTFGTPRHLRHALAGQAACGCTGPTAMAGNTMGQGYAPPFERTPFDWSAEFHDLVGKLARRRQQPHRLASGTASWWPRATWNIRSRPTSTRQMASRRTVGMHLIIGNQAIPGFSPGASRAKDNDGMPDGWDDRGAGDFGLVRQYPGSRPAAGPRRRTGTP